MTHSEAARYNDAITGVLHPGAMGATVAAGDIYQRLGAFKDASGTTVDEMLEALLG